MKYFTYREFDSPDLPGSGENMDARFLSMLGEARELAGLPFVITSGYRTKKHHEAIYEKLGKKPTRSAHLTGNAADIKVSSSGDRFTILKSLILAGFKRIGIADNFIHVDNSNFHTQNLIWKY